MCLFLIRRMNEEFYLRALLEKGVHASEDFILFD
jgi:hypothetical protein